MSEQTTFLGKMRRLHGRRKAARLGLLCGLILGAWMRFGAWSQEAPPGQPCGSVCVPDGYDGDDLPEGTATTTCAGTGSHSCASQGKQCGQEHRTGCTKHCRADCCVCCSI